MDRGRKIARSMHEFLPDNFQEAVAILIDSLEAQTGNLQASGPMASFLFLPHTYFVAFYGLSDFEDSMHAQYILTQRFTAEFSIRPFLEEHTEATLLKLTEWVSDPNDHVRRLISEGTRPRLPWAPRLRNFQEDLGPVIELLEHLKDDSSDYVRRSVANNLNDIGKDHPKILLKTARRWIVNAPDNRRKLVRHALRSLIKKGDPEALSILGFGHTPEVKLDKITISPERPEIGGSLIISFVLQSTSLQMQRLLVDFRIHYLKVNGSSRPKVFKLKQVALEPQGTVQLGKKISLAEMTTRKHYPGDHKIDVLINGHIVQLGSFSLVKQQPL